MLMEEIEKLIEAAHSRDVSVTLTPDKKVLIDGPKIAARETAKAIGRDSAAVIKYLKTFPSAPKSATASASELSDDEAIEVSVQDDAPTEAPAEPKQEQPVFTHCPKCHEILTAPAPKLQVQNFDRGQHERTSYFWWSETQLKRLEDHLEAHPGHVLVLPAFAHSVNIRRPDGSVYTFNRVK